MAMAQQDPQTLFSQIELALMHGTLNLNVTNQGRLDPSTETVRRKGGVVGTFNTVRLIPLGEVVADPILNPYFDLTQAESFRLGDAYYHSRMDDVTILEGR